MTTPKTKRSARPAKAGPAIAAPGPLPSALNIDIPSVPGGIPQSYQLVASTHLFTTMGKPGKNGRYASVRDVRWECYGYVTPAGPQSRNTVWIVGSFPGGAPIDTPIDLHDIGAQHRGLRVWMRASSVSAQAAIVVQQVERQGKKVDPPDILQAEDGSTAPDRKGFYLIDRSGGYGNDTYENRYVIVTQSRHLLLEVFFDEHPPGVEAQPEDGGPPPLPPVAQEH